ncbi:uncharacterized protein E0L32_008489 [Thyridium curvatum]|uniref:GTPase-activating protein GYP5 n=1 Tax=Thyridium curvatum TaxID=1093900 RepID=A0A507AS18_9PEZI|nr:uncharacterized protein E0L32_008489 [Thyridium curvatum]TPX10603.1 hypothetical protein E0L32_008489 [Thyridium curvatum]
MSQHDEVVSPESPPTKEAPTDNMDSSAANSDREDTFEDAQDAQDTQDTKSVRSLTARKPSLARQASDQPANELEAAFKKIRGKSPAAPEDGAVDEEDKKDDAKRPDALEQRHSSLSVQRRISDGSNDDLDNVNLDDETTAAATKGPNSAPTEKEPSKTLSLSSITNALPSMPWSPPAVNESPVKNPSPRSQSPPAAAVPTSLPTTAPAPVPAPPTRKLTSPFAWLSRNSGHKESAAATSPPPATSPRRNTASSVATLTSNPEMMLSKLDEEREGDGNENRNSLKDRFKLLRMREEAGLGPLALEDDKSGAIGSLVGKTSALGIMSPSSAAADEGEHGLAVQPPPSPLPQSPNPSLAPGTASGVTAGPSAFSSDAPVDWDLWQSVVYEGPAAVARTSAEELNKAIATGIPNAIRGVIWQVLAQSKNEELEQVYKDLVARGTEKDKDRHSNGSASVSSNGNLSVNKEPNSSASSVHSEHSGVNGPPTPPEKDAEMSPKAQAAAAANRKKKEKEDAAMLHKLEKAIRRDLGARTSYSKFAAAQGLQEGLFGVCKAYALFDEGVGYAQGMNFLIMPLLFNMPEQEAFCLLVRLMNQYHLRDLFIQDMPGLHMRLYQFERLLEDLEPALYCHLHRRSISSHLYATQWFLTLFAYRFPLQLVLRIYDLIFSEGLSAILRFGIVLMQKNASTLLQMSDMAQLTTFLKDKLFDVYIDAAPSAGSILENGFFGSSSSSLDKEIYRADEFVRDACDVKITPELLKTYSNEWEEKTRAEKERETELEHLRSSNASYAIQVRKLEERIEAVDREQAALATELVHTKVENEELKDENESLKGQVRELKIVIEKQPEEIEQTWKLERDDLMKRNQKVHEENQKVEKEMSELEEELVQTKLRYAEINSSHETLMRKWTDLKRQFE